MKKPSAIKLRKLVRVREKQRDQAAAEHTRARTERTRLEGTCAATLEQLRQLTNGATLSIPELERLGQVLEQAKCALGAANGRVESARSDLESTAIALRRSEKLETQARTAEQGELETREQAANDDRNTGRRGAA